MVCRHNYRAEIKVYEKSDDIISKMHCREDNMADRLKIKADELIGALNELDAVKSCTLYGSLAAGTHDALSDIDIEVDVSGFDNGKFMLELPKLLKGKIDIYYVDFAPSLIPERYIVSIAVDDENPFMMADLCCRAEPHCATVTRQDAAERNGKHTHMLKLWTANLKHYVRGADCRNDITRMAQKLGISVAETKTEVDILSETLRWLEVNADAALEKYMVSCRRRFEELKNT